MGGLDHEAKNFRAYELIILSMVTGAILTEAGSSPGKMELFGLDGQEKMRIINGTTVKPQSKYPSMVMMWAEWRPDYPGPGRQTCAGTILNKHWVLTAGHCLSIGGGKARSDGIYFISGSYNVSSPLEPYSQNVSAVECILHQHYTIRQSKLHDICVCRVQPPFIFNQHVTPVNLPKCDFDVLTDYEEPSVAVGWGVQFSETFNPLLQEVVVKLVTTGTCQAVYGFSLDAENHARTEVIADSHLCAGVPEGGLDACQGDSGGPLYIQNETDNTHTQVGITSFGRGCAKVGIPGVYTRVARYLDWIEARVNPCKPRAKTAKNQ